jgi:hypothetical protein
VVLIQTFLVFGASSFLALVGAAGAAAGADAVGAAFFGSSLAQAAVPNANIPAKIAVDNNFILFSLFFKHG